MFILLSFLCVYFGIASAVPTATPHIDECRSMMDLILVIDGSDSISSADYVKQRLALAALMKELNLGPKQAQVGMVVYSTTIAQTIDLTHDRKKLIEWAQNMVHPRDGTMTSVGIAKAREMFESTGRDKVPWVCIVITDGHSKYPSKTANESSVIKDLGVNMFAVGITNLIEPNELEAIASDPSQVLMLQTFDQLKIALSGLMKVVCPCPLPPPVPFGIVENGSRAIGSVRHYACKPGYQPMGNDKIECLKDSTWSPLEFSCLECPPPPVEFGNAMIVSGGHELDTVREYICKTGFSAPHPITTQCVPGPEGPYWTTPNDACLNCPPIMPVKNAYFDPPATPPMISTTIRYNCNPGFVPTGPIESTCVEQSGVPDWTPVVHQCIACEPPPYVKHAEVDPSGNTLVGAKRDYQCNPGFLATGPIQAICMGENGATYWKLSKHVCKACSLPPKLPNAVLQEPGDTLIGTVRLYTCLQGFQPTGPIEVVCVDGPHGEPYWDGPEHKCVACVAPPILPNAILNPKGDTLIGSVRTYTCMEGFIPTGPIEVGCINGVGGPLWTNPEFQCVACDKPSELPNAILDASGSNLVGHKRHYHCVKGFIPSHPGPISIECIGDYHDNKGKAYWSPPSHECIACPDPPIMDFAVVEPGNNLVGTERRYKCIGDYHPTGPIVTQCMDNAQWSIPEHSCKACGPVPLVPDADVLPGPHVIGTLRRYKCHKGLVPTTDPVIECMHDALWSPVMFKCVGCEAPPIIHNAILEPGENYVGSVRRYVCTPGLLQTGPITSTCTVPVEGSLPVWSEPVHSCKDCAEPYLVEHADIIPGPRTIGSITKYECHQGFVPSALPHSHCMQNAEWSPPDFKCINSDMLSQCMDLVGEMYRLSFAPKDYCQQPIPLKHQMNTKLIPTDDN